MPTTIEVPSPPPADADLPLTTDVATGTDSPADLGDNPVAFGVNSDTLSAYEIVHTTEDTGLAMQDQVEPTETNAETTTLSGETDNEPKSFGELRDAIHIHQYLELRDRIATNVNPTPEELSMGALVEEIEPQVRGALLAMRDKGYATNSSGFYGAEHDLQAIDGPFIIGEETAQALEDMDIEVQEADGYTWIGFRPNSLNPAEIEAQWGRIVAIMPDLGQPAVPSENAASSAFWKMVAEGTLSTALMPHWLASHGVNAGFPPAKALEEFVNEHPYA